MVVTLMPHSWPQLRLSWNSLTGRELTAPRAVLQQEHRRTTAVEAHEGPQRHRVLERGFHRACRRLWRRTMQ